MLDRGNLGGITAPVTSSQVTDGSTIPAAATYQTGQGSYVAFRASSTMLSAFRITATNPPAIASAWSVPRNGRSSPFVTSTDGANDMVVWVVDADGAGHQLLHGFDGDTGNVVYAGGGPNELMVGARKFNTGIAARGRIYIANDNKVYAFVVSSPTPTPTPTPTGTPTATPTPSATPTPTPTATVQVTVQTAPAGLAFSVDGTTYSSTQTFSWARGSSHTIATTSPQSGGTGVRYVWTNWIGGGAISHTVAPTTNTIYTANFNTQYYLTMTHGTGGTVSPMSAWKNSGATVSISATPAAGPASAVGLAVARGLTLARTILLQLQ